MNLGDQENVSDDNDKLAVMHDDKEEVGKESKHDNVDTCCGRELLYDSGHHTADDSEEIDVSPHQPALPAHQVQVIGQGETLPGTLHHQARQGAGMQAV